MSAVVGGGGGGSGRPRSIFSTACGGVVCTGGRAVSILADCGLAVSIGGAAGRGAAEAEVPEALFDGMRAFLQSRPEWDQYRLMQSAVAGFLFQQGSKDPAVVRHYLNGLFRRPGLSELQSGGCQIG